MEQIVDMYGTPIEVGDELVYGKYSTLWVSIVLNITLSSIVISVFSKSYSNSTSGKSFSFAQNNVRINEHNDKRYLSCKTWRCNNSYVKSKNVQIPECLQQYVNRSR